MRLVAMLCAAISIFLIYPAASAQNSAKTEPTAEQLVDDLHRAFGTHPMRAIHAKGILFKGSFKAAGTARGLSSARLFDGRSRPITLRFSDFPGTPDIADASADANPRGLAFKIHMGSEKDYDVVAHSFNGFPVATSGEFGEFMRAIGASRETDAHPTPLELFLDAHPIAKAFVTTQKPPPQSFATTAYFGVNAFKFISAARRVEYVRYRLVPASGEHYLSVREVQGKNPDYLLHEITARVAKGPVQFDWYAQIAESGDIIDNPSRPWPNSRRRVKLGTLTIDAAQPNAAAVDNDLIFLPGRVPSGIEIADPMLTVRNDAYAVSLEGRSKPPSTGEQRAP